MSSEKVSMSFVETSRAHILFTFYCWLLFVIFCSPSFNPYFCFGFSRIVARVTALLLWKILFFFI